MKSNFFFYYHAFRTPIGALRNRVYLLADDMKEEGAEGRIDPLACTFSTHADECH